ncbi:MAG: NAD(P)-dependent alcohol dehydrogenase [Chitinophagales bacterium]
MKKAINTAFGDLDKISIVEVEIPVLGNNEVLVKVTAAGLNPKDIMVRKGKFKRLSGSTFPQNIGYDFAGTIENPNKSDFKKGTPVFGMLNGWRGGCCAEYVNVKLDEFYEMPENVSFEAAAGISLAGQTALQAIRNLGQLKEGAQILINGASGGVGTLAIQIAKELGGVVTTVSSSKNLNLCQSFGADDTVSYQEVNIPDLEVRFDVFFDVFGNYSYKKISHLLTPTGRYVTTVPKPAIFREQFFNLFRRKKAKMVIVKSNKKDLAWFHEKMKQDKVKPVVDKVFTLAEIKEAQAYISSKRAKGKVILKID